MKITLTQTILYRGKIYRAGETVEVNPAEINRRVWKTSDADEVNSGEPAELPPLKKR